MSTSLLNDQSVTVDGVKFIAQNFPEPYSREYDPSLQFMFTVLPGPPPRNCPRFDTPNKLRSEVYGPRMIPFGSTFNAAFEFMIEPESGNGITPFEWLIPFQIHGNDDVNENPPSAFYIAPNATNNGEVINFRICWQAPGGKLECETVGFVPFKRGTWIDATVAFVDSDGIPGGSVVVTIDGVEVANWTGVTGLAPAVALDYPKFGTYAGVAAGQPMPNVPIVAYHGDLTFSVG